MRKAQRGACTNYRVYNKTKENVSALSANDPAEEALYAAAKSRFWSDVSLLDEDRASKGEVRKHLRRFQAVHLFGNRSNGHRGRWVGGFFCVRIALSSDRPARALTRGVRPASEIPISIATCSPSAKVSLQAAALLASVVFKEAPPAPLRPPDVRGVRLLSFYFRRTSGIYTALCARDS